VEVARDAVNGEYHDDNVLDFAKGGHISTGSGGYRRNQSTVVDDTYKKSRKSIAMA